MSLKKGLFIVIDGPDGSGKATQTKLLVERLKKECHEVELADFPQYGHKSAGPLEEYLNGEYGTAEEVGPYRASIFFACDRYAASPKIKKWIKERKIVVTNRYVSANMGHQAGKIKDKNEREKFMEWLEDLEYNIFGIPKPDINILLCLSPEIGQTLVDRKGHRDYIGGKNRDIHEADLNHLKDATEAYKEIADKSNWIKIDCAPNKTIDSLRTPEDISEEIYQKVKVLIDN